MTVKKRRKKRKNQDAENLKDILTTLLVGFIVILFYKEKSLSADNFGQILATMAPIILIVGLIFAGALVITRRQAKVGQANNDDDEEETIGSVRLEWGQALKHDLLIFLTPTIVLALPILLNQEQTLTDFFQAMTAFLALIYLKKMYWQKII